MMFTEKSLAEQRSWQLEQSRLADNRHSQQMWIAGIGASIGAFATIVAVVMAVFLLLGCEAPSPRVIVEKTISEKLAATEQRLGFDAFDTNNGLRSRATTVYYLIAEDGTMIEVTLQEYARVKIGQAIHSDAWK